MSTFDDRNLGIANEIIVAIPAPKSALIPLLHLARSRTAGYRRSDAHIAELST